MQILKIIMRKPQIRQIKKIIKNSISERMNFVVLKINRLQIDILLKKIRR